MNNIPSSVGHCYGEVDYVVRYLVEHSEKTYSDLPKVQYDRSCEIVGRSQRIGSNKIFLSGILCLIAYPIIFSLKKSVLDLFRSARLDHGEYVSMAIFGIRSTGNM